jgi:hypothetical protein
MSITNGIDPSTKNEVICVGFSLEKNSAIFRVSLEAHIYFLPTQNQRIHWHSHLYNLQMMSWLSILIIDYNNSTLLGEIKMSPKDNSRPYFYLNESEHILAVAGFDLSYLIVVDLLEFENKRSLT